MWSWCCCAYKINKNNIGAFYLHQREWEPILLYPNPILPGDKVGLLPTFWEGGSFLMNATPDFLGGHPSQYYSGPKVLNFKVMIGYGVVALVQLHHVLVCS